MEESLQRTVRINEMLEKQLGMSEENNERLRSALESMNDELEDLKAELKSQKNN